MNYAQFDALMRRVEALEAKVNGRDATLEPAEPPGHGSDDVPDKPAAPGEQWHPWTGWRSW